MLQHVKRFRSKEWVFCNFLQSLLGKLFHVAKIVVPARAFLNCMLWYLRGDLSSRCIRLGQSLHYDLCWFEQVSFDIVRPGMSNDMYVDASQEGFKGLLG